MKYFWFLVFGLFLSFHLMGQEPALLDKVTLKTGEVYIGEIVVKTDEIVMLKTRNGTRYQFQMTEVKQIEKVPESKLSNAPDATTILTNEQPEGNFSGQLDLSGGIASANGAFVTSPNAQISFTFGNRKVLGKDLFVGIGAGNEYVFYDSNNSVIILVPVFLRIQSILTKEKTAPFIGMDAGYAFTSSNNFGGGPLVKLSFGLFHKISYKTAFYAGITAGITSISADLTQTNELGSFYYHGQTSLQNIGLKFGLQF